MSSLKGDTRLKEKLFNLCRSKKLTLIEAWKLVEELNLSDTWILEEKSTSIQEEKTSHLRKCSTCDKEGEYRMRLSQPEFRACTDCINRYFYCDTYFIPHIQHLLQEFSVEAKTIAEEKKILQEEQNNLVRLNEIRQTIKGIKKERDILVKSFNDTISRLKVEKAKLLQKAEVLTFKQMIEEHPYAFLVGEVPAEIK
jgi:hypothetical protein